MAAAALRKWWRATWRQARGLQATAQKPEKEAGASAAQSRLCAAGGGQKSVQHINTPVSPDSPPNRIQVQIRQIRHRSGVQCGSRRGRQPLLLMSSSADYGISSRSSGRTHRRNTSSVVSVHHEAQDQEGAESHDLMRPSSMV
ncbi:hypothetical protein PLESTM_000551900 [Pleodorina starrii]|nr:hypothetical protein PLESTM_000551900 [Pleodorina starrii]